MAVAEIKVPSAQAEDMPAVEQPAPPLASFAGAQIGSALEEGGEELFGAGMQAYHRAAEAQAQDKETEFQKKALEIRDQYKTLFNMDAIKAHSKAAKALEQARADAEAGITTKSALGLFKNNSLRNMRLIQESMDSHFEQQNKQYQFSSHKQGQDADARDVAAFAADGNLKASSEKIEEMQQKARKFAETHGLDADAAEEFATTKGAHALIKTMLDAKSPSAKAAYDQWGDKLEPSFQAAAQKTIAAQSVVQDGETLLAGLPRVDADHKVNAKGAIFDDAFRMKIGELPADEHGAAVRSYVEAKKAKIDVDFAASGRQMEDRVYRLGQGRGPHGEFAVPEESSEWQEFQALHPKLAKTLAQESRTNLRRATTEGRADAAYNGKEAFGRVAESLYETPSDQLKLMTPADVASQVRQSGGRPQDVERAQALLAKMQGSKASDHVGKEIPSVARDVLGTVNAKFARVNRWQAIEYLDALHSAHPDWTRAQLGDDLQTHIAKGFFGRASLSLPASTKPAQKSSLPPPGRYKKPDGSIGSWDGAKWN